MRDVLGFCIWLGLHFVLCIVTDIITLESHKNLEVLRQHYDPSITEVKGKAVLCINKTPPLTAPDFWMLKWGETHAGPSGGHSDVWTTSNVSGNVSVCTVWALIGLSQHILQRITITLLPTDSPFHLCYSATYWQSREKAGGGGWDPGQMCA